jgi:hypothetical protein
MAQAPTPTKSPSKSKSPLATAWEWLDQGDVVLARRDAQAVLGGNPTPEETTEARDVLRRTGIPKEAFLFAGLAVLCMMGLILLATLRFAR